MFSQLVLFQKRLWVPVLFFLKERNSVNCIGGIFQWLSYLDTFTETQTYQAPYHTTPHQAVAANNLGYQGLSATPETPEKVQQHILDDVITSGSEKGKKWKKRRIAWLCITLLLFMLWRFQVFSLGQEVRHGASGVQQPPLRKYGGMGN